MDAKKLKSDKTIYDHTARRVAAVAGAFLLQTGTIAEGAPRTLFMYQTADARNKVVSGRAHGFLVKAARKCR
jgi:hypothetical protein